MEEKDYENKRQSRYDQFVAIANYLIIAVISVVGTAFIPMVSAEGDIYFNFPTTAAGWIVWVMTKVTTAIMNILIFHCFVQQGKLNSLQHPNYKEAMRILAEIDKDRFRWKPKSPRRFLGKEYGTRGSTIFLMTILSLIGFSFAILAFDLLQFLAMIFTTLFTIIMGYLEMRKVEEYWQNEFLAYALHLQQKIAREHDIIKEKTEEPIHVSRRETVSQHPGTGREEQA